MACDRQSSPVCRVNWSQVSLNSFGAMKLWGFVTAGAMLAQSCCRLLSAACIFSVILDATQEVSHLTNSGTTKPMLNLSLKSLGQLKLVASIAGSTRHFHTYLSAWRQIATLIWLILVPRFSLTSSRPYVLAVPGVSWTSEQIVGYFIGKTVRQLVTHHKAKQMFRWLVEEVNGNFVA